MSILDMAREQSTQRFTPSLNRELVEAAVAFHIGGKLPGIGTQAVDPMVDRFMEMAASNPQLVGMLQADVKTLFALTDADIAAKIARGEPLGELGDLFDAIAEVSWEVGATELAARINADAADAMSGQFEALTSVEALDLALEGAVAPAPGARFAPDMAKAAAFQTLFDTPGAWSYSPSSRTLAVTVGDQTVGITTRPGFEPQNHLDVMAEVVAAQADGRIRGGSLVGGQKAGGIERIIGAAHNIGSFLDEHPWARSGVDVLWFALSTMLASPWRERDIVEGLTLQRHSDAIRDEKGQLTAESIRLASMIPLPEAEIAGSLARLYMEDLPGITSKTALELAADTVAENRDVMRDEFEKLSQPELLEMLQADIEGRSSLGAAIESGMGSVLDKINTWDLFTQWIGINVIDIHRDVWGSFGAVLGGDVEEGYQRFEAIFTETPDVGTTGGEYFGLTGGWADAASLAVGGVFDPTNFLLVGGSGMRALARSALSHPEKYASTYLRMGSFPHIAKQIANAGKTSALTQMDRIAEVVRLGLTGADEVAALAGKEVVDAAGRVLIPAAEPIAARAATETVANTRGVMSVVGSSAGLGDAEYVDMLKLAINPSSTVDDVNEVWTRALKKNWLPNTLGGPVRHNTIEGIGRWLDAIAGRIPGITISPARMDDFFKYMSKAATGRTFQLGESQSMTNLGDLAITFFPADSERAAGIIIRAGEARMAVGDPLAMAGAAAAMNEQARREILDAAGPISQLLKAGDPAAIGQNLRSIEETLTGLSTRGFDEATETALRTELNRMHSIMSRRVADAAPRLAALQDQARAAHHRLKAATVLEADSVRSGNALRNVMAEQAYLLYDDMAVQLNKEAGKDVIPVIVGEVNPFAPNVPVRDWSAVTGVERGAVTAGAEDLTMMMGMAADNVELAAQANAIGMLSKSQHVMLPASPYEVLVFQKLAGDETLYRRWMTRLRKDRLHKWSRRMKLAFVINLLFTPLTAGKITLDETTRFLAVTGKLGKFVRASVAGIPGVGTATEAAVKHYRGGGSAVASSYGAAHSRKVEGMFLDDFADYGWVDRPPRRITDPTQLNRARYRMQVERWINGSLLQDDRFRQYARWIDEATPISGGGFEAPDGFVQWWERGGDSLKPGSADTRPVTVDIKGAPVLASEITATDVFNIVDRMLDNWLGLFVDEPMRAAMRKRLLRAAVTAGDQLATTGYDARLLNAVSRVPGVSGQTGPTSRAFNVFFGGPAGRRAGVFYEQFFEDNFEILTARHGNRVLTVERLMEHAKLDRDTAEFYLKQGADNATVSQIIADTGAVTEAQLAAAAAANAARRTDDLMYTFASSSLLGRGAEAALMFPFARAQVDFLSWWVNHMFKPLTFPVDMETRARLAGTFRGGALELAERVPLNLRAWARYAHMVATVNNDQPSPVDQMIDGLTFFPMRFGPEFLLNVSPQFGPLPSWAFDAMVDAGWIGEEVEKEIMTVFPALGFTELADDPLEDLFNRILPNSRRSLRDYTVGMLRGAYALTGQDIHTKPGLLGGLANIIADNKVPAATGDFQVALGADWLKDNVWDMVVGSEEWNEAVIGLSVDGAIQANRAEWTQDQRDRVLPLTGYDAEYRALRAFEGLFDDHRFAAMATAGLFSTVDLSENADGVPRIKEVWDRHLDGSATREDLEYLDDRLTSIYFETGRLEVLPGFSYMDYLHLTNPELAVNLIAKNEDSGGPSHPGVHRLGGQQMTRAEFRAQYINRLTGRLQNVPPGPQGAELVADARRIGWVVSRSMESSPNNPGWMQDAAEAVYKSGQRALRGVWETVSHRTWSQGTTMAIEDRSFTLGRKEAMILQAAGMDLEAGTVFTYGEFHELLDDFDERFDVAQPLLVNTLARGAVHGQLAVHDDEFGLGLLEDLAEAEREFGKLGIDSVEDWPEASKQVVRERFNEAITRGYTTLADYNQEIEPLFGPIDYEPPTPPPVADLEGGIRISGDELDDVAVIDGDTVSLMMEDGPMRIRLIGINAPEVTQPGYAEARGMLEEVIAGASEVVFGIYQPEVYGLTQLTAPGERRLLAWLYVDRGNGIVPLYDPSVFTADNPRGAGLGGTVLDLMAILEAGES